ncbi:hypothetical protein [Miniphocaeibacter massiliensis]|uniref:hypothetical protein n=1 Tax=Miniphocaeibacter massiliensis TaxID=2041841 RepID=UPI000C1C74AE|nr:hypothetical protein [Miniphocaeibacter massiliensis]
MRNRDIINSKRIVNSILNYMMERGVEDINFRLKVTDEVLTIIAEGKTSKKPKDLDRLNALMNDKRTSITEEYYSALLGYSDNVNDIDLLGSMLDEGAISYDGELLSFFATRKI